MCICNCVKKILMKFVYSRFVVYVCREILYIMLLNLRILMLG